MNKHDHEHGDVFHSHAPMGKIRRAFYLTLVILIVEVVGGYLSHSLALLADAGHVLTDIAAIGLSWYALRQATRPTNQDMTWLLPSWHFGCAHQWHLPDSHYDMDPRGGFPTVSTPGTGRQYMDVRECQCGIGDEPVPWFWDAQGG